MHPFLGHCGLILQLAPYTWVNFGGPLPLNCRGMCKVWHRMAAGTGVLVGTGGNLTRHLPGTSGFRKMAGWPAPKGLNV